MGKDAEKVTAMKENMIIGREYERHLMEEYCDSGKAELIAVYGRRRVGKTYLVRQMFDNSFAFSFTGMYDTSRAVQLEQFRQSLERYSHASVGKLKDWFSAFSALRQYLESLGEGRRVVFLDELPWMDTAKSNFLAAFSFFWNDWASNVSDMKIIVCGSATTWMLSHIIGDKGGLYGRVSRPICLSPFSLGETAEFLKEVKGLELSRYQVLNIYMVLGGIPYYLNMLEGGIPVDACVDRLFFRQNAPLRSEFSFLFRSLFNESRIYRKVVETLSRKSKGMTRRELMDAMKLAEGGKLTEVLDNLIQCDFIRRYNAIGKSGRDAMYQLTDLFSLFHLRFVSGSSGQDENLWSNMRSGGQRTAWSGYAFEQVCLHHIRQIKIALGISGVLSNVCSWSCRPFTDKSGVEYGGGQIDLLIDRNDGVIDVCEIKYSNDEYVIDSGYERRLRERASLLLAVTKTKKAVQHVFITTYGVKRNMYSGIVQSEVTLADMMR